MAKLAIFSGSDMRNFGGGEKYVIEFVNRLKEFDITIFSFSGKEPFRLSLEEIKKLVNANIEYYDAPELPIAKERVMLTWSGFETLKKLKEFDVVYCLDNSLITNLLLTRASKQYGFRYVLGVHDANILRDTPIKKTAERKLMLGFYKHIRNFGILEAPNIRVINATDGEKLRSMGYKGNVYSITDFVNVKPGVKVGTNSKEFIALFVGRLSISHKGIDLLCEIIEKTIASNDKIVFHIVGSGDDGEELARNISSKYPKDVKWLGFVDDKKLLEEYANANLLIFPSRFESFGLSLAEGQGYGLPGVAFNVRGPDVIMRNKTQGVLIKPFDVEAFSSEVVKYYSLWKKDKKSYFKLKQSVSKIILSRFGEKEIIPKLVDMLSGKMV